MSSIANHRYQMILQADLPHYAVHEYNEDIAGHRDGTYILGNVLSDLFTLPEIQTGERRGFIADIFRGVPKDPNKDTPLIHNVRVSIRRVVCYRSLDQNANYPACLAYVLYGAGGEAHLSHQLTKAPDFQHVVTLRETPNWLTPVQLEAGVMIDILGTPKTPITSNPLRNKAYNVQCNGQEPTRPIEILATKIFNLLA